jgi:hypothetical protein
MMALKNLFSDAGPWIIGLICAGVFALVMPLISHALPSLRVLGQRIRGFIVMQLVSLGAEQRAAMRDATSAIAYSALQLALMSAWFVIGVVFFVAATLLWWDRVSIPFVVVVSALGGACWISALTRLAVLGTFYEKTKQGIGSGNS